MRKVNSVFIGMLLLSIFGVAIEVINPHSFLLTTGAFVRALIFIVLMGVWVRFSKRMKITS